MNFVVLNQGETELYHYEISVPFREEYYCFIEKNIASFVYDTSVLTSLIRYNDKKFSNQELDEIKLLCNEMVNLFRDFSKAGTPIYPKLKQEGISPKKFIDFASSLINLIYFAQNNNKDVWALGD